MVVAVVVIAILCALRTSKSLAADCSDTCDRSPVDTLLSGLHFNCSTNCLCSAVDLIHVYYEETLGMATVNVSWKRNVDSGDVKSVAVGVRTNEEYGNFCMPHQPKTTWCKVTGKFQNQVLEVWLNFDGKNPYCLFNNPAIIDTRTTFSTSQPYTKSTGTPMSSTRVSFSSTGVSLLMTSSSPLPTTHPYASSTVWSTSFSSYESNVMRSEGQPTTSLATMDGASDIKDTALLFAILGSLLCVVTVFIIIFLVIKGYHKCNSLQNTNIVEVNCTQSSQPCSVWNGMEVTPTKEKQVIDGISLEQFVAWTDMSCRKVWLSFPTQHDSTRRAAQCLAEALADAGIGCLSALLCQTEIAMNTYERVHELMKSADLILCCCNEDFHSSWMKIGSLCDKDPDWVFYHECIHINKELKMEQYKHLAIVLLESASPHCIPDCLQATLHYRFPNKRDEFDLIHRIQGSEPNSLRKAIPPVDHTSLKLSHCTCPVAIVKESEL